MLQKPSAGQFLLRFRSDIICNSGELVLFCNSILSFKGLALCSLLPRLKDRFDGAATSIKLEITEIQAMPGYSVPRRLLKNKNCLDLDRYVCSKCELLLKDPVLPCCGHRLCKSCADGLPAPAKCPRQDCKKDFVQENGEIVSLV